MHIFRRDRRRRTSGSSETPSDSRPTPSHDQAGPSQTDPPVPSHSPPPVPSPVPARHSCTDIRDSRESVVPCGDSFENSVMVIREINRIVNNHWRGDSMTYTSTPTPTKELWWSEFRRSFTWDPTDELEIRRIFKKKCGDHIRHVLNHAKTRGKKPPFITDENWTKISSVWETDEYKEKSQQNKTNQAYNAGDSSASYAGGSINIDEHTRRLTKELGKKPAFIETFTRTFTKKDKTWSGERAKHIKEKYTELEAARSSSCGSGDIVPSEDSVGNELALWLEASGGQKGGRILGMGSLSRTQRPPRTSTSTRPEVTAQINSLTEEVTQLKGQLLQRDEQMRQRDREMREMRRQQAFIMQHLQLGSGPSQIPASSSDDEGGDGPS